MTILSLTMTRFQHTAARRRLEQNKNCEISCKSFQHTAARRRLAKTRALILETSEVSTHSRPKAAG